VLAPQPLRPDPSPDGTDVLFQRLLSVPNGQSSSFPVLAERADECVGWSAADYPMKDFSNEDMDSYTSSSVSGVSKMIV
jgi:hypothetical protein